MAKIPEVGILSFWNLKNSELPEHALSGQIIIVQETQDMYVGTGSETPILKVSDLSTVETVNDLEGKNNGVIILYIVSSTNELYFFYNNELRKCNGLGIAGVYAKYIDLPSSNLINGLFCVSADETNNGYSTLYAYVVNIGYLRLHYSNFDSNTVHRIKVGTQYVFANKANNEINIITDNTLYTSVDNRVISINQKPELLSTIRRERYPLVSGTLEQFPESNMSNVYSTIVNDELWVIGYSTNGYNFVNKIYKYNKTAGWSHIGDNLILLQGLPGSHFYITSYNNKIYLFGGWDYFRTEALRYLYEFDPTNLTFIKKADMISGRADGAFGIINNKLWLVGGRLPNTTGGIRYIDYYDFDTDTWTRLPNSYNIPINFYAGSFFTDGSEIHFISITNAIHSVFNVDTLSYYTKNNAAFTTSWTGTVKTSYGTVYCLTTNGIIYSYNINTDSWINCGNLIYNRVTPYVNIDSTDTIYTMGHYTTNTYSRELEILQPIRFSMNNDCQIVMRQPINKKIQYGGNSYRSVTVEKDNYIEYIGCGGDTELDIIIKEFN